MDQKKGMFSSFRILSAVVFVLLVCGAGRSETVGAGEYLIWGIEADEAGVGEGSVITEAVLTIRGLNPAHGEAAVYLVDDPAAGIERGQVGEAADVFAEYGTTLTGRVENGDWVCRLSETDDPASEVWGRYEAPFDFPMADGSQVRYSSSLLQLNDFIGNGKGFGACIASNSQVSFESISIQLTIASYEGTYASQDLTIATDADSSQDDYALRFDGESDIVSFRGLEGPVNNFTVSAWVKTGAAHEIDAESDSGADGTSGQRYLCTPQHMGAVDGGMGLSVGTNGVSVYEHGSGYLPALAVYRGSLGTGWNHVAVTYTNKRPRIYVNGHLVHTGLASSRRNVYAPNRLGGLRLGWFQGEAAGFRIWERPLDEAEVLAEAKGSPAGAGLLGDWTFDEGTGSVVYDSSGNGHDGDLYGPTWMVY